LRATSLADALSPRSSTDPPHDDEPAAGRRVLVTGAGSGIGRSVCERLAGDGCRLWLVGRRFEPLEETAARCRGRALETVADSLDVTDEAAVSELADRVVDRWGALEGMVGSAGQTHFSSIENTSLADWTAVLAVNLTGPFLMLKHLLPALRAGRAPAVVHIASTLGLAGLCDASAYCASKAGLVNLTRAAALETAREGVRVNAVCPAVVDTGMLDADRGDGVAGQERRLRLGRQHPVGRIATPAEIATVVASVLDPRASFLTGAVIPVDGGMLAGFLE
jgi:NAD(P)-dependent dehydrogenase (short-subunit alcohol dehydrogenase family)